ncbi:MAG: threonine/serine dehydratase [Candidatus Binatus sp.]|uniref:threonine ammonia-lyase n=1 Tax=Candidatus Binatus sp. TaxID=2811406 RepID=UPI0027289E93|nr:threonine/serine dehydratase [Candidatus Binatus sp.]MDO8434380.1 threonine/serine dehydratase [Candidatus Binatus sp.]
MGLSTNYEKHKASEITIREIREAATRIKGYVRRTPLMSCSPVRDAVNRAESLQLKLECLQVTGSFKARGAVNKLKSLTPDATARGIITASGGNHGLAVAYAGRLARVPATIYLPVTVSEEKIHKLNRWDARLVIEGASWDDSNRAALAVAERDGMAYFHPFADPVIIAGQGTIGLEILEDAPDIDTIVVAIGGGGMISGVAIAAHAIRPGIRIIGVEPVGAATVYKSIKAGHRIELEKIETAAGPLGARASEQLNLDLVQEHVSEIFLVTDDEMRNAARWLWFELGIAAELAGAAAVATILGSHYRPAEGERVCAVVCGSGTDGIEA